MPRYADLLGLPGVGCTLGQRSQVIRSSSLRVVVDRPSIRLAMVLVLLALGLLLLLAGFYLGREQALRESLELSQTRTELQQSRQQVEALKRRLADLNLSTLLDDQAYESLRQSIKTLQDQLAETEEEVRFYRQLMAPSADDRGLRIERLELTTAPVGGGINYRLLLTQVVERHDWIRGNLHLEVVGQRDGEQLVLPLTELSAPDVYPLAFRFRYFQTFTGTLEVPADFEPQRVIVKAQAGNAGRQLERTFNWVLQEG